MMWHSYELPHVGLLYLLYLISLLVPLGITVTTDYFGIERHLRICCYCDSNAIGDEFHYLFECNNFTLSRKKAIPHYYITHPNAYNLEKLMNTDDRDSLTKLALFSKFIMSKFK